MISVILQKFTDAVKKAVAVAIPLAISDWLLGFVFGYVQLLFYHAIIGFRIFTSPFLHRETAQTVFFLFSVYYFLKFVRFLIGKS